MSSKNPDFRILDQNTGQPTGGFFGPPTMEFEARAWFLSDGPDGEVSYEWIATPPNCVQWTDETFAFKRKFRIAGQGTIECKAKDFNGFYLSTPKVNVKAS
jgi:hypothetical protein